EGEPVLGLDCLSGDLFYGSGQVAECLADVVLFVFGEGCELAGYVEGAAARGFFFQDCAVVCDRACGGYSVGELGDCGGSAAGVKFVEVLEADLDGQGRWWGACGGEV